LIELFEIKKGFTKRLILDEIIEVLLPLRLNVEYFFAKDFNMVLQ